MAQCVPDLAGFRRAVHGCNDVLHGGDGARAQRARHVLRVARPQSREPDHVLARYSCAGNALVFCAVILDMKKGLLD